MSWVAAFFAGGDAWFAGLALALLAVGLACATWRRAARLVALLGLVVAGASATPQPWWVLGPALLLLVAWLASETDAARARLGGAKLPRAAAACALLLLMAVEVPWRLPPALPAARRALLYVIGDSISAGMGVGEDTWPRQLARTRRLTVVDLSQAGATVRQALGQAQRATADDALVLVEIGGNDLLGTTSAAAFEEGLDRLLATLTRPARTLVLLELPLPPLCEGYGRAQRRLAARHGAALVPRRRFMTALAAPDATLDGLHLSNLGHAALASMIGDVVAPALVPRDDAPGERLIVAVDAEGRASLDGVALDDDALLHALARRVGARAGGQVTLAFATSQARRAAELSRLARGACVERVSVVVPDE